MTALARFVTLHKAVAHPVRMRILCMLADGPLCGCQISAVVKQAPSTVSEHLAELRRASLVSERKEGRWVEYSLGTEPSTQEMVAATLENIQSDPRIRADRVVTRALRRVPLEELCRVDNDLGRLERSSVASAVARADRLLQRHSGGAE